jgi:hypothetical protein
MRFYLMSHGGEVAGEVTVSSLGGALMLGSFAPAPQFRLYEQLFEEFEQAANDQLFVEIDRLEREIVGLDFYLIGPFPQEDRLEIEDLQIMGNDVSFRLS